MYLPPSLASAILLAVLVLGLGCSWVFLAYLIAEDENEKRVRPVPLDKSEVNSILNYQDTAPSFTSRFNRGDTLRIIDGPFLDFIGSVEEIDEDKSKVTVMVSFFGRDTPVELDFYQVEKE